MIELLTQVLVTMPDALKTRPTIKSSTSKAKPREKRFPSAMNAEDLEIAAKLRSLRQLRGMTLPFVGDKIGVTSQQIQKYETGNNRITAGTLNRLANLYGVPGSHFFGDDTLEHGGLSEIVKLVDAPDARELAHVFATIEKPALRRAILTIAKTMAESTPCSERPLSLRRATAPKPSLTNRKK